jgi:cytochrome P450
MRRHPTLFDNSLGFDPDRWVTPGRANMENFWSFSKSPQNCLGQELVMTESVLALVFTVRFFDFELNYPSGAIDLPIWEARYIRRKLLQQNPRMGCL